MNIFDVIKKADFDQLFLYAQSIQLFGNFHEGTFSFVKAKNSSIAKATVSFFNKDKRKRNEFKN